ncbi:hypothetical protein K440DRAFT_381701 [Wilcoxina mikolae CBS 423.85]|nr:hypothetical protein K440DRAFT_381701 [Wilcoxina mikolae CBS 423.85]
MGVGFGAFLFSILLPNDPGPFLLLSSLVNRGINKSIVCPSPTTPVHPTDLPSRNETKRHLRDSDLRIESILPAPSLYRIPQRQEASTLRIKRLALQERLLRAPSGASHASKQSASKALAGIRPINLSVVHTGPVMACPSTCSRSFLKLKHPLNKRSIPSFSKPTTTHPPDPALSDTTTPRSCS